jgi:hypothetical protein
MMAGATEAWGAANASNHPRAYGRTQRSHRSIIPERLFAFFAAN